MTNFCSREQYHTYGVRKADFSDVCMILAAHVTKVASNSLIIKQEPHCLNWPLNMGIKKKNKRFGIKDM